MAACCATFRQNAVLPMAGRAATMTRSDGWKPAVLSSKSLNPDATPVIDCPPAWSDSMRSIVGQSSSLSRMNPSVFRVSETSKIRCSALSRTSSARRLPSYASCTMLVAASMRRRSIALSRTILAW